MRSVLVVWLFVAVMATGCAPKPRPVSPSGAVMPPQLPGVTPAAQGQTADLGKRLYTTGLGESGKFVAFEGGSDKFKAKPVGCVVCHGADGRGVQGPRGLTPAVTFASLCQGAAGKPALYPGEDALKKAIVDGAEPNGEKLNEAMPRWKLNDIEWGALLGYLKSLDSSAAKQPGAKPEAPAKPAKS